MQDSLSPMSSRQLVLLPWEETVTLTTCDDTNTWRWSERRAAIPPRSIRPCRPWHEAASSCGEATLTICQEETLRVATAASVHACVCLWQLPKTVSATSRKEADVLLLDHNHKAVNHVGTSREPGLRGAVNGGGWGGRAGRVLLNSAPACTCTLLPLNTEISLDFS